MFGSFEDHVLNKVRNSVFGAVLYSRATANPNAQRDGPNVWHRFRDDADSVGQRRALNFTNSRACKDHGFLPF
jgi:hypothetical protein